MTGEPQRDQEQLDYQVKRNGISLARLAMMTDDLGKVLAEDRAVVSSQHKMTIPDMTTAEEPMINVGDTHNHTYTQPQAKPRGMSPLMSGLLGAGLLATGIGGPLAGYFIADAIRNIKPAAVTVPPAVVTPGDGNTKYRLELLP